MIKKWKKRKEKKRIIIVIAREEFCQSSLVVPDGRQHSGAGFPIASLPGAFVWCRDGRWPATVRLSVIVITRLRKSASNFDPMRAHSFESPSVSRSNSFERNRVISRGNTASARPFNRSFPKMESFLSLIKNDREGLETESKTNLTGAVQIFLLSICGNCVQIKKHLSSISTKLRNLVYFLS